MKGSLSHMEEFQLFSITVFVQFEHFENSAHIFLIIIRDIFGLDS